MPRAVRLAGGVAPYQFYGARVQTFLARDAIVRVGAMLRRMREDAGLTQTQLAQRAAMDQSEIGRLKRGLGRHGPSVETLAHVTEALGHALVVGARPLHDDTDDDLDCMSSTC